MVKLPDPTSLNEQIADELTMHMVDLERYKGGMVNQSTRILKKLETELVGDLAKINPTEVSALSYREKRQVALLVQTRATINTHYQKLNGQMAKSNKQLVKIESEFARQMINSPIGVELASVALSKEQIASIASDTLIEGAKSVDWWKRQAVDLQKRFADQIRLGMLKGEGLDDLVKRIRGTKANNYKDGIMEVSRKQAEALIRTSVQTVTNEARNQLYLANQDVIGAVQQRSTLDMRTTPTCIARSGLIWSLPDYEPVGHDIPWDGGPPLHWSCRSTTLPVTRSWQEMGAAGITTGGRPSHDPDAYFRKRLQERFKDKLASGKMKPEVLDKIILNAQASMDGYVPNDLNYEAWLKTKPEAMQIKVLGKGKWELWNAGKITVTDLVNEKGRPLTLAQLQARAVKPAAIAVTEAKTVIKNTYPWEQWQENKALLRAERPNQPTSFSIDDFGRGPKTAGQYAHEIVATVVPGSETTEFLETWNEYVRMSPEEFLQRLTHGLDGNFRLEVYGRQGAIGFSIHCVDDLARWGSVPGRHWNAQRTIRFLTDPLNQQPRWYVDHTIFEVAEHLQGTGIGKQFLENSVNLYEKIGIDRITTHANIDVGGYAWAKYGFLPKHWDSTHYSLETKIRYMADLDDATRAKLMAMMTDDPKSFWTLADCPIEYTIGGKTRSLGKHMLLGEGWEGVLDLNDHDSYLRLMEYIDAKPNMAIEKAAMDAAREAAEKLAKEAAEKLAKEAAEKLAKEAAEKLAKEAAEKLAKEAAEKAAREAAEQALKAAATEAKTTIESTFSWEQWNASKAVRQAEWPSEPTQFTLKDFKKGLQTRADTEQQYLIKISGSPERKEACLKLWNEHMRVTPEEFAETMTKNLDGNFHVKIVATSQNRLKFVINCVDENPATLGEHFVPKWNAERIFDVKNGVIEHSMFTVYGDLSDKGIGKVFLKNSFELYEKVGVKKITTLANLNVGGYAWARYGYVPDAKSWEKTRAMILGKINKYKELDDVIKADLTNLLTDDPKSIWAIVDYPGEYTIGGKTRTLGKHLLLGEEWKGVLDLTDQETYLRFVEYIDAKPAVAMEAAEKAAKEAAKKAAKEAAKKAAEKAAREAAEKAAKEAAEKVAREAAEKLAKEAAKKVPREAAEKLAKEAAEKLAKIKAVDDRLRDIQQGNINMAATPDSVKKEYINLLQERKAIRQSLPEPKNDYITPNDVLEIHSQTPEVMEAFHVAAEKWGISDQEYLELLDEHLNQIMENKHIHINAPTNVAEKILEGGRFKSQFETRTSCGTFDPDYRAAVEEGLFGVNVHSPDKDRPIYGYISRTKWGEYDMDWAGVKQYGDVSFRLKVDVKTRASTTFTDSLACADDLFSGDLRHVPQPANKLDWRWIDPTNSETRYAKDPLSHNHYGTTYYEAQVYNGVTIDDVEKIIFNKVEPSPRMKYLMREKNIQWEVFDPDQNSRHYADRLNSMNNKIYEE